MLKLAIATSREHAAGHPDDASLFAALSSHGIAPVLRVWDDPTVNWADHDAVLVRTIWDYYKHHARYLAWLSRLETAGVPVFNPIAVLRWNADKRYLIDLERLGLSIIPTRVLAPEDLTAIVPTLGWDDVVVKPAVSAGAWHTLRGRVDDPAFLARFGELPRDATFLVQPFVPEITSEGEWSFLFFGGEFSHAVLKQPRGGDFRVQEKHGGSFGAATPPDALIADAHAALARLDALSLPRLAYARVDGVARAGRLMIMELELIEPQLFLAQDAGAGARFARHLARMVMPER